MKSQVLGFLWTCSPPHRCVSGQHHWTELSSWEGGCAWLTTVRPVPTATMSPSTSRPIPGISNAEARQPGKAPNFSVNWTVGDSAIEVINATTGKDELGRASRLCKHALYCRWMRVHGKVLRRPDPPPTRGHPSLSPLAALSWQSGPASSDPKQAHPTTPVPPPRTQHPLHFAPLCLAGAPPHCRLLGPATWGCPEFTQPFRKPLKPVDFEVWFGVRGFSQQQVPFSPDKIFSSGSICDQFSPIKSSQKLLSVMDRSCRVHMARGSPRGQPHSSCPPCRS